MKWGDDMLYLLMFLLVMLFSFKYLLVYHWWNKELN